MGNVMRVFLSHSSVRIERRRTKLYSTNLYRLTNSVSRGVGWKNPTTTNAHVLACRLQHISFKRDNFGFCPKALARSNLTRRRHAPHPFSPSRIPSRVSTSCDARRRRRRQLINGDIYGPIAAGMPSIRSRQPIVERTWLGCVCVDMLRVLSCVRTREWPTYTTLALLVGVGVGVQMYWWWHTKFCTTLWQPQISKANG